MKYNKGEKNWGELRIDKDYGLERRGGEIEVTPFIEGLKQLLFPILERIS